VIKDFIVKVWIMIVAFSALGFAVSLPVYALLHDDHAAMFILIVSVRTLALAVALYLLAGITYPFWRRLGQ